MSRRKCCCEGGDCWYLQEEFTGSDGDPPDTDTWIDYSTAGHKWELDGLGAAEAGDGTLLCKLPTPKKKLNAYWQAQATIGDGEFLRFVADYCDEDNYTYFDFRGVSTAIPDPPYSEIQVRGYIGVRDGGVETDIAQTYDYYGTGAPVGIQSTYTACYAPDAGIARVSGPEFTGTLCFDADDGLGYDERGTFDPDGAGCVARTNGVPGYWGLAATEDLKIDFVYGYEHWIDDHFCPTCDCGCVDRDYPNRFDFKCLPQELTGTFYNLSNCSNLNGTTIKFTQINTDYTATPPKINDKDRWNTEEHICTYEDPPPPDVPDDEIEYQLRCGGDANADWAQGQGLIPIALAILYYKYTIFDQTNSRWYYPTPFPAVPISYPAPGSTCSPLKLIYYLEIDLPDCDNGESCCGCVEGGTGTAWVRLEITE